MLKETLLVVAMAIVMPYSDSSDSSKFTECNFAKIRTVMDLAGNKYTGKWHQILTTAVGYDRGVFDISYIEFVDDRYRQFFYLNMSMLLFNMSVNYAQVLEFQDGGRMLSTGYLSGLPFVTNTTVLRTDAYILGSTGNFKTAETTVLFQKVFLNGRLSEEMSFFTILSRSLTAGIDLSNYRDNLARICSSAVECTWWERSPQFKGTCTNATA